MDIYVMNKSLEIVGVVDIYSSVIWTTRYFQPGDFELYLPASDDNIVLLREDFYLVRDQDIDPKNNIMRNVMIIEKINPQTDVDNGNYLTVTGKCLKSILSRRVVWRQTTIDGYVEAGIRRLVNENVINPVEKDRAISNFSLAPPQGFADRITIQITGDNLSECVSEMCTSYGIGWDVYVQGKQFVFSLFRGEDRSYNQMVNPYVVFSPEFDNLITSNYIYSKEEYKNVALVAGEGEGVDRKTVTVGNKSGLERYEIYVDSRDTSSNEGEITELEYNALLADEGMEALSETGITESFECEIEASGNYKLNQDYFIGDIVEVINEYGIETAPRIVEIIDSENEMGRSVIPTFTTWEV